LQGAAVNFLTSLEKRSRPVKILLEAVLIGATGIIDLLTGYELAFSVFYVFPISLAAWVISRRAGIIASIASALVWLWADIASGHVFTTPFIPAWNTIIRLLFFIMIAVLLSALKNSMDRERELARIDYLTGAVNSRLFFELLRMEIERSQRYEHPVTLAYVDLDNFKAVNDGFGHPTGDQVLQTVAAYAGKHLRKTDVIARLGGDEFALLLPETGQEDARKVLAKLQSGLLEEMRRSGWPVTFSVGVVTCSAAVSEAEELIKMADELMYAVKHDGKNAIKYSVYAG
jgi:diguanylate cyclase (GGDEF)-like protein